MKKEHYKKIKTSSGQDTKRIWEGEGVGGIGSLGLSDTA